MHTIAPDYLDRLGLPRNASRDAIESALAAQEARCRVLLKIPTKRVEGTARLELIAAVRAMLDKVRTIPSEDSVVSLPEFREDFEEAPEPLPPAPKIPERVERPRTIIESEPIVDEGGLGDIRRRLNQWASAIPHHEYLTFGNTITIVAAEQQPIYFVRFTKLTESRLLCERQSPYLGEPLPANTPISADAVSVWAVRLPEKQNYEPESREQPIAASRRRVDCPRCQRRGEIWCTACQSTGTVLCSQCKGRYQFSCSMCGGSGMVTDRFANNRTVACPQCRSAGVVLCGNCRDGWSQCGTCRGYRRVSCSECAGRGELLHSLSVQVDYKPEVATATIFPSDFPDYARKRFVSTRYETASAQVLRLQSGRRFDGKAISEIPHEALRTKIDALVACGTSGENEQGERRTLKHLLEVRSCPAIQINYTFEERSYELWIVGESGDVYCRTSPIHEYDQKLARQAGVALAADDLHTCLEKLGGAFRHTPNSATALVVLGGCVKKLEESLRAGRYDRVSVLAREAEDLLGPIIAVSFPELRKRAVLKMRLEYAVVGFSTGTLALLAALIALGVSGEVYAWDITLWSGLALMIAATTLFSLLLASGLSSRSARSVTAATVSLVAVLASCLFGLVVQQDYLSRQKREALERFGRGDYESAKSAIEPLESALWAAPRDFELQLMLGRAYVRATYYEKAIQALNIALELSGGRDGEVHNELGLAFLGKGETSVAAGHFRRAIALRAPEVYLEAYQNFGRSLSMVYLSGGTFMMGSWNGAQLEKPPHAVNVTPFFIDRFEVTNQQYFEFVRATHRRAPAEWSGSTPAAGTGDWPVTGVSLEDARAFTLWRAQREGLPYRLPTEAEWEFAARGAQNRRFPWGNEWNESFANIRGPEGRPRPVGSFPKGATPEGVEDLLGNAAEWVDGQLRPYAGSSATGSGLWVIRGGSYAGLPEQASTTARAAGPAEGGDYRGVGFRCALSADAVQH